MVRLKFCRLDIVNVFIFYYCAVSDSVGGGGRRFNYSCWFLVRKLHHNFVIGGLLNKSVNIIFSHETWSISTLKVARWWFQKSTLKAEKCQVELMCSDLFTSSDESSTSAVLSHSTSLLHLALICPDSSFEMYFLDALESPHSMIAASSRTSASYKN